MKNHKCLICTGHIIIIIRRTNCWENYTNHKAIEGFIIYSRQHSAWPDEEGVRCSFFKGKEPKTELFVHSNTYSILKVGFLI